MRGKREAGREEKERESFNLWVKKKKNSDWTLLLQSKKEWAGGWGIRGGAKN